MRFDQIYFPGTTVLAAAVMVIAGCGRTEPREMAGTPAEAASQLQTAFAGAPEEFQRAAREASEALRNEDLTRAVESLATIKASENVTLQQGLAVHTSLVLLESRLVAAADAGDAKAREAYALLKRLKQK
ncbi:MAG TPA: hypothetical protein PLX89_09295 [Verrucomicrobiota bacterium]|nr:hypothetical protein [Verrucomicrobiales bacterium]HRI13189.1 hypothetical protein [Verrucomicrobiota bacterium]